jgi:hypothetical protein
MRRDKPLDLFTHHLPEREFFGENQQVVAPIPAEEVGQSSAVTFLIEEKAVALLRGWAQAYGRLR